MSPAYAKYILYMVKHGDTLIQLAKLFKTTVSAILSYNPNVDFSYVYPGQVIAIPKDKTAGAGLKVADPAIRSEPARQTGIAGHEDRPKNEPGIVGNHETVSKSDSAGLTALRDKMRLLWGQHAEWIRLTMISEFADLPDLGNTTARLLRNAADIAAAFSPYIGKEQCGKIAGLLTDHLAIFLNLLKAKKSGNVQAATDAEKRWKANADSVAEYLNSVGNRFSAEKLKAVFYDHLALMKNEMDARLNKEFQKDIELHDQVEGHALEITDMIAESIVSGAVILPKPS